jgi:hypothetical protein
MADGEPGTILSARALRASARALRLVTVGVGAQRSPRFAPAGLLVVAAACRLLIDGGPDSAPAGHLDAWLVCDERSELMSAIRRTARQRGLEPRAAGFTGKGLVAECLPVVHTSHPAYGYRIRAGRWTAVWAPEFWEFPGWAAGADLMFAEAAGWERPIRFARGVGGHMAAVEVAEAARRAGVRRLVLAHVGRPTIRAMDRGARPPFGEFGADGREYRLDR